MAEALPSSFTVMATGQIESAEVRATSPQALTVATACPDAHASPLQIPGCDNAYLKFQLVAGEDWQLLDGLEEGITQAARCSQGAGPMLTPASACMQRPAARTSARAALQPGIE